MQHREPLYSLIDIGANLTHESFNHDLPEVLNRARKNGINSIIVTGSDENCSQRALAIAMTYPNLYSTAGIHPHHAKNFNDQSIPLLQQLAANPKVKAIGECGLDYYRNFSSPEEQTIAFTAQLELAIKLQKPLFLHQRDAHEDFLKILKPQREKIKHVVVHCFTGTKSELFDYLDIDCYIGITGWICEERGFAMHKFIHTIPLNRLMIETDAPYLLPKTIQPKPKSRRNEPANLPYVLTMLASCYKKAPEEIAEHCTQNSRDFFEIDN